MLLIKMQKTAILGYNSVLGLEGRGQWTYSVLRIVQ